MVRVAAVVTALALVSCTKGWAQSLKSLPPNNHIEVSVGAYLIDFEEITEETLTYTVSAYVTATWHDPRLLKGSAPDLDRAAVTVDQIWWPNLEFANEHEPRQTTNSQITIDDDGRVKYEERFTAKLAAELDLRRFPFDSQTLPLSIESFRYDRSALVLTPIQGHELVSPRAFLAEWHILGASQRMEIDDYNPERRPYSRYNFEIRVQRKAGFYLWNICLPLLLIAVLAWSVFWIAPEDISTRTGISITALLTAIAFSLVIADSRPRVSYITFMDAVFLSAYAVIFLAAAGSVFGHVLIRRSGSPDQAEAMSRICLWAFPLVFLLSNLVIAGIFLT
jgi:Neurotransmitter-gated ion-channel ligand binding domain/Neurotransmitter-gated ion-channel transmembrane region